MAHAPFEGFASTSWVASEHPGGSRKHVGGIVTWSAGGLGRVTAICQELLPRTPARRPAIEFPNSRAVGNRWARKVQQNRAPVAPDGSVWSQRSRWSRSTSPQAALKTGTVHISKARGSASCRRLACHGLQTIAVQRRRIRGVPLVEEHYPLLSRYVFDGKGLSSAGSDRRNRHCRQSPHSTDLSRCHRHHLRRSRSR